MAKASQDPAPEQQTPPQPNGGFAGGQDIGTIRDILFGAQMRDYDTRFAQLEQHLQNQVKQLTEQLNTRFDQLEALVQQEVATLNARMDKDQAHQTEELNKAKSALEARLEAAG